MAAEMAMLNVRMERELREQGNAVLAELGVTPSELVRALWEKIARSSWHTAKAQVETVMTPERTPEQQMEIDRKKAAMAQVDKSWQDFIQLVDLDSQSYPTLSDDKDELAEARYDYLREKWGEQA